MGLAQAALNVAVQYSTQREQFGKAIATFQGLFHPGGHGHGHRSGPRPVSGCRTSAGCRGTLLHPGGHGETLLTPAMSVTTNYAVQVLGSAGYVEGFPGQALHAGAKVLQIVEGTNEIQRLVIGRALTG